MNAVAQYTQSNAWDGSVRSDICVVTLYCTLKRGHAGWLLSCHGGTQFVCTCFVQSGKPYEIQKEANVRYDRAMCINIKGQH